MSTDTDLRPRDKDGLMAPWILQEGDRIKFWSKIYTVIGPPRGDVSNEIPVVTEDGQRELIVVPDTERMEVL